MVSREAPDKLSIYIPKSKMAQKPVERLVKLGEKLDRSVNYLSCGGDPSVCGKRGRPAVSALSTR